MRNNGVPRSRHVLSFAVTIWATVLLGSLSVVEALTLPSRNVRLLQPKQRLSFARPSQQQTSPKAVLQMNVPLIEKWRVLDNGSVRGVVSNHPSIVDGDIITTSPLKNPAGAKGRSFVMTASGSKYRLGDPFKQPEKAVVLNTRKGTNTINKGAATAKFEAPSGFSFFGASNAGLPMLEKWKVLGDNRVMGYIFNHPTIPDGQIISSSPIKVASSAKKGAVIVTNSGSKYKLGEAFGTPVVKAKGTPPPVEKEKTPEQPKKEEPTPTENNRAMSVADINRLRKETYKEFQLTGETFGTENKYLMTSSFIKSTSGKSTIFRAYRADDKLFPIGEAVTIKVSSNVDAMTREADNYGRIAQSGVNRGKFVEMIEFLPPGEINSSKGRFQSTFSALVLERGDSDLKTYLHMRDGGPALTGKALREAAVAAIQCVQAAHESKLVWSDLKTENFVVMEDDAVRGIDLESAIPNGDNPVDYSPEACPPEFAIAFLEGEGPYFQLEYSYDIWSYGMLLYELGTGRGYFDGRTPIQITRALCKVEDIRIERKDAKDMDPRFTNLVESCLKVNPRERLSLAQILLHPYFLTTGFGPFSF